MNKEILMVIETVSNEKNVSKEVILDAIEHALASSVKKKYRLDRKCEHDIDARVSINLETGEYKTYRKWEIVNEIEDEEMQDQQLIISDAREKNSELNVGDFYEEEIESIEFGRIVASAAKNVIVQKVREAERSRIVDIYQPKIGQLIFGIVKTFIFNIKQNFFHNFSTIRQKWFTVFPQSQIISKICAFKTTIEFTFFMFNVYHIIVFT